MRATLLIVLGLVVIVVVAAAALGAAAIVTVLASARVRQCGLPTDHPDDRSPSAAYVVARRHASFVEGLAWAALVAVGLLSSWLVTAATRGLSAGVLTGLVPALAGAASLVVHAVGELTWPRPTGSVRRAPLTRRTVAGIAPHGARRLLWTWAGGLGVTLVVCGLTSVDGRAVAHTWDASSGSTAGPYPGWFYGVPLLAATGVVLGGAEIVLRLVAHRPAVVDTTPDDDLALRSVSARRVLRSAQLVLALTLAGVMFVAGLALRNVGWGAATNGIAQESVAHVVGGSALSLLGVAIACVGVAAVVPRTRRRTVDPFRRVPSADGNPSGQLPA